MWIFVFIVEVVWYKNNKMPLLHCIDCHHEWEGSKTSKCDWCGSKGYILEEKTSLEKLISSRSVIRKILSKFLMKGN